MLKILAAKSVSLGPPLDDAQGLEDTPSRSPSISQFALLLLPFCHIPCLDILSKWASFSRPYFLHLANGQMEEKAGETAEY